MRQWTQSASVQIMACRLISTKPLSEPVLEYCWLKPLGSNLSVSWFTIQNFSFMKMHLKMSSVIWQPFCPRGDKFTWQFGGDGLAHSSQINWPLFCRWHFQICFHDTKKNCCIMFEIFLRYVLQGPINSKSALVWIMAAPRKKPLPEPILTQFPNTCGNAESRHQKCIYFLEKKNV